jgi:hypothetical protein
MICANPGQLHQAIIFRFVEQPELHDELRLLIASDPEMLEHVDQDDLGLHDSHVLPDAVTRSAREGNESETGFHGI